MKKQYSVPQVEVEYIAIEENILSNGENLNVRSYGSQSGEDADDLWS